MLEIDGQRLTLNSFAKVVGEGERVALSEVAKQRMLVAHETVEKRAADDVAVYGLNTGFGELSRVRIAPEQVGSLQERLILSHSAGVGEPLTRAAVRGMLLLRANTLARGHSGIRVEVVERLLLMLNEDFLPVVPSRGSVGASGDLAPLAHLALPLLGKGRLRWQDEEVSATEGLARLGVEPIRLRAKEGLALINGTQAMTALLALACVSASRLVRIADLVGALSADALRSTDTAFDPRLHELRPHPGQQASAANLWKLMQGSKIRQSHRQHDPRVQDPYSVRCMPQVHGAVRDVLTDAARKVEIEMNSVTDNPLVFPESGDILSGGNFHGEPIAIACDCLALGVAELGSIGERRIEKLTNPAFSGLPAFLIATPGLNSGFMMAQVTAAALASENKGLAHPASVDSIPTSADMEDHVSMGMGAALKLQKIIENTTYILAIELAAAAQGIDLHQPLKTSKPLQRLHEAVRLQIRPWTEDREMAPDLDSAYAFLGSAVEPFLQNLQ